jgi:RNA polymerase sigma factor (sigma-70 family)
MHLESMIGNPSGAAILAHREADVVVEVQARSGQALFGYARRLGLTDEQATDAVQETLVRLWRELRAGREVERPEAWAFRAVHHLAMDQHRLRRRVQALAESLGRSAFEPPRDAVDRIAVWSEVDRLPSRQRQVLYLHYRADLRFEDVAAVLGISAGAARSHASRGVEQLRSRFAAANEGGR